MGSKKSKPIVKEKEEDNEINTEKEIGEGATSKVYKKGNFVIKRTKYYPEEDKDFDKEIVFFGWINSFT